LRGWGGIVALPSFTAYFESAVSSVGKRSCGFAAQGQRMVNALGMRDELTSRACSGGDGGELLAEHAPLVLGQTLETVTEQLTPASVHSRRNLIHVRRGEQNLQVFPAQVPHRVHVLGQTGRGRLLSLRRTAKSLAQQQLDRRHPAQNSEPFTTTERQRTLPWSMAVHCVSSAMREWLQMLRVPPGPALASRVRACAREATPPRFWQRRGEAFRVFEVVDLPHPLVSALLPLDVFEG
jgi:hypothetical protein